MSALITGNKEACVTERNDRASACRHERGNVTETRPACACACVRSSWLSCQQPHQGERRRCGGAGRARRSLDLLGRRGDGARENSRMLACTRMLGGQCEYEYRWPGLVHSCRSWPSELFLCHRHRVQQASTTHKIDCRYVSVGLTIILVQFRPFRFHRHSFAHPATIQTAIRRVSHCYCDIPVDICSPLVKLGTHPVTGPPAAAATCSYICVHLW